MDLAIATIAGLVIGHGIRRATPYLIDWQDKSLPFRYPWVEICAGVVFALIGLERGLAPDQWKWFLLAALLLSVTSTDHLSKYIPDKICYVGAVLGVILSAVFPQGIIEFLSQKSVVGALGLNAYQTHQAGLALGIAGAAMGWVQMEFIRRVFRPLVKMDVMGGGDTLLMLMAGAFLGPQMILYALLPACLAGIVAGAIWKVVFGTPHFPFGPSLSLGALFMALYGGAVVNGVGKLHGMIYELHPGVLLAFSLFLVILLIFLILRLKSKAAEYERMIEEDYKEIDEKINQ